MNLLYGIIATGIITAVLSGTALYGFRKKKLPLRSGGYLYQVDQPIRFRVWIFIFAAGATFSGAGFVSLIRQLLT